ncbi:MAG: hypothetical protein JXR88_06210 [Clostridia bacterium]|nr:hypothetical protein [Clostridia bacterium]
MLINKDVQTSICINDGKHLFLNNHIKFAKFGFLAVMISYFVSVYWTFFDTFLAGHPLLYVLGLILLLLMYFPIIYYSIRITIANAEWLKGQYAGDTEKYSHVFQKSRDKFWRIFFVQLIKFLLKSFFIILFLITWFYYWGKHHEIYRIYPFQNSILFGLIGLTILIGSVVFYILYRMEFADLSVFWDIDIPGREFKTSWLLTKYYQIDKIKIVMIAHLPNFILSTGSMIYVFNNIDEMALGLRWTYLIVTIILNTFFYSWRYAILFPVLNTMRCLEKECKTTVDEDGREWLSF